MGLRKECILSLLFSPVLAGIRNEAKKEKEKKTIRDRFFENRTIEISKLCYAVENDQECLGEIKINKGKTRL